MVKDNFWKTIHTESRRYLLPLILKIEIIFCSKFFYKKVLGVFSLENSTVSFNDRSITRGNCM